MSCLHICFKSLISFNDVLWFSECEFYTSFVTFIPIFDAIVNGFFFWIVNCRYIEIKLIYVY